MTAKGRKAVVFDLDGTLIDSHSSVLDALNYAIAPFGGEAIDRGIFAHLGGPPETFIHRLVRNSDDAPKALSRLYEFFAEHGHEVGPFPEVDHTLSCLREIGVTLGVWTGRDRYSTDALLKRFRWGAWFAGVVCGDDLKSHKPNPEGMSVLLAKLAVDPGQLIYVGDADVDVLAGSASGISTILVSHGRGIPSEISSKAVMVCRDQSEAYRAVLRWSRWGVLAE